MGAKGFYGRKMMLFESKFLIFSILCVLKIGKTIFKKPQWVGKKMSANRQMAKFICIILVAP